MTEASIEPFAQAHVDGLITLVAAEGWTEYTKPGPTFKGQPDLSTDMLYLDHIDHHNALGLGEDVLLAGDVNADSFWVLRPQNGQMQSRRSGRTV